MTTVRTVAHPGLDPTRAREWLTEPSPDEEGLTVAESLGVHDDTFGYADQFEGPLEDLVAAATDVGLFGPGWRVLLWRNWESDGTTGGGIVTVDPPDPFGGPEPVRLRLATGYVELRRLTTDQNATGPDAAIAVLTAVAQEAREVADDAARVLATYQALTDAELAWCREHAHRGYRLVRRMSRRASDLRRAHKESTS
jgi:hypothetical protein